MLIQGWLFKICILICILNGSAKWISNFSSRIGDEREQILELGRIGSDFGVAESGRLRKIHIPIHIPTENYRLLKLRWLAPDYTLDGAAESVISLRLGAIARRLSKFMA